MSGMKETPKKRQGQHEDLIQTGRAGEGREGEVCGVEWRGGCL